MSVAKEHVRAGVLPHLIRFSGKPLSGIRHAAGLSPAGIRDLSRGTVPFPHYKIPQLAELCSLDEDQLRKDLKAAEKLTLGRTLRSGDRVEHPILGQGKVTDVDLNLVSASFYPVGEIVDIDEICFMSIEELGFDLTRIDPETGARIAYVPALPKAPPQKKADTPMTAVKPDAEQPVFPETVSRKVIDDITSHFGKSLTSLSKEMGTYGSFLAGLGRGRKLDAERAQAMAKALGISDETLCKMLKGGSLPETSEPEALPQPRVEANIEAVPVKATQPDKAKIEPAAKPNPPIEAPQKASPEQMAPERVDQVEAAPETGVDADIVETLKRTQEGLSALTERVSKLEDHIKGSGGLPNDMRMVAVAMAIAVLRAENILPGGLQPLKTG